MRVMVGVYRINLFNKMGQCEISYRHLQFFINQKHSNVDTKKILFSLCCAFLNIFKVYFHTLFNYHNHDKKSYFVEVKYILYIFIFKFKLVLMISRNRKQMLPHGNFLHSRFSLTLFRRGLSFAVIVIIINLRTNQ